MIARRLALGCLLSLAACQLSAEDICVQDARDRAVCVNEPAQRLVSLSPGATELLFSAGAGERVLAVSAWSDYPPQAARLPQIGDSNRLDLEAIVALAPDLLVAWSDGNSQAQLDKVSALGIPVFWLAPRTFGDIADTVEQLATLVGKPEVGAARADDFRLGIARLAEQYRDKSPVRVFYQVWDQPLMTVNGEELISKAIALCGGENVFAGLPRLVPRVSVEAVIAENPDAIISAGQAGDQAWQQRWRAFPELTAVTRNNLFLEPPSLLARPTLRMLNGARHLCQTLEQARASL